MPPLVADLSPADPATPTGLVCGVILLFVIGMTWLGLWLASRNRVRKPPPGAGE
jgi:hypothetical protein